MSNIENEEEIRRFIENNKRAHFLQSPEWAKVKTEWEHEYAIVRDEKEQIKGVMSILLRKVPIFHRYIMYAPRGFVCDEHDKDILLGLTEEAKKIAKKYKAFIFRLDPDISKDDEEFQKIIKELGYKTKNNIKSINQVIQPKYVFRLNVKDRTEEELLASFHSKTRYNIRLATKKGVTIREGNRENLKSFHDIMKTTGSRDEFFIRPLSYFEKIYDSMGAEHIKLIIAEYEGKPISAVLPIKYGNKVWYLYGGSSNEHRNLMPNYLLQWEMIKMAIARNDDVYDFRGVSGVVDETHPQYGLYRFKQGFGATFTEFIGEVYLPFKPLIYKLYRFSEKAFRTLRQLKMKMKK